MTSEADLPGRALEEASQRDSSLSGLARFARMLAPGSNLSVQTHGSPARPRYSAALAAAVMAMSLQVQAQVAPDHALPTATPHLVAHAQTGPPALFTASDTILSHDSRSALGRYTVRQQNEQSGTPIDERINGTLALVDKQVTRLLGIPVFSKMTCEVILVPFPDGHLIPGDMLPERPKTKDAALDLQLQARDLSDHKLLDRFIFYHEDSHCDAVSWSSVVTDEIKHGAPDKLSFNAAANHLSKGIKAAAVDAVFPDAVLRQYSPEQFGKMLAGERYSDARAALHLGQYMLVQKGASIEDYERVLNLMLHVRENEKGLLEHYHVMNDHDTTPVLKEVLKTIKQAHADPARGLSGVFGEAASQGASPVQMNAWSEHSAVLARAITQSSLELHTSGILEAFHANLIAHEKIAGTLDQPKPPVFGEAVIVQPESGVSDEGEEEEGEKSQEDEKKYRFSEPEPPADSAGHNEVYREVSRLKAMLKAPSEHDVARERMH